MNNEMSKVETTPSSQEPLKNSSEGGLSKKREQHKPSLKRKAADSSRNASKGIAMVRFDSKTKQLNFNRRYSINGESAFTNTISVSLSDLTEVDRQFVISLIKHTVAYCNGNNEIVSSMAKLARAELAAKEPQERQPSSSVQDTVETAQGSTDIVEGSPRKEDDTNKTGQ